MQMYDFVDSMDERFRHLLFQAFNENDFDQLWSLLCEQIEIGDLKMKTVRNFLIILLEMQFLFFTELHVIGERTFER